MYKAEFYVCRTIISTYILSIFLIKIISHKFKYIKVWNNLVYSFEK